MGLTRWHDFLVVVPQNLEDPKRPDALIGPLHLEREVVPDEEFPRGFAIGSAVFPIKALPLDFVKLFAHAQRQVENQSADPCDALAQLRSFGFGQRVGDKLGAHRPRPFRPTSYLSGAH